AHFAIQEGNVGVPRLGFSVNRRDCTVDNLTFAHEVGHNQGTRHDRGADNSEASFPYAHGYLEPGGTFRTVMAVFTSGVDRVQYFSNPDVLFMGLPMGIAPGAPDSAHNALAIDGSAFNVSNFRASVPQDCNDNAVADSDDIINGTSADENDNGIPDECEIGEVLYVSAGADGANDGSGWTNAFTDLSVALEESQSPCRAVSQIWVAAGTYVPGSGSNDRLSTFKLYSGVEVYGGFAGGETSLDDRDPVANLTILSGDLAGDDTRDFVNNEENAYHVVNASDTDHTARLDGFVIERGNSDGATGSFSHGAGMYFDEGDLIVANCVFRLNSTHTRGGAIGLVDSSSPLFVNCRFLRNRATGGQFADAGAISSLLFNSDGDPVWVNCEFSGNGATGDGGAVLTDSPLVFINCTFSANVAAESGGAFYVATNGDIELKNCILWLNIDEGGLDESAQIHRSGTADVALSHSILMGLEQLGGPGTFDANPGFVDFDGPDGSIGSLDDDLRLVGGSPAIDAGDNTAMPADTADIDGDGDTTEITPIDLNGIGRFFDDPDTPDTGTPDEIHPPLDIGAHELRVLPCNGDVDESGTVGFGDILTIIAAWGPCPGCLEDLNGNDVVDFADILVVIANWGPCPE
ncbi:MAG: right-handed parallel beta-helix repeat-containing protein, partial [Planctomycetota bacterium]